MFDIKEPAHPHMKNEDCPDPLLCIQFKRGVVNRRIYVIGCTIEMITGQQDNRIIQQDDRDFPIILHISHGPLDLL